MTLPEWARKGRSGWRWTGAERPPWAAEPGPGQESVWDYPRPPALDPVDHLVVVRLGRHGDRRNEGERSACSRPPTLRRTTSRQLRRAGGVPHPGRRDRAAASGRASPPTGPCAPTTARVDERGSLVVRGALRRVRLDPWPPLLLPVPLLVYGRREARVRPQAGGFYGGWVTDTLVGALQGGAGFRHLVVRARGAEALRKDLRAGPEGPTRTRNSALTAASRGPT